MARMTLAEASARRSTIDRKKLVETSEDDIRRHQLEDGYDPDAETGPWLVVLPPGEVRRLTGLSQAKFAAALRIPVGTIENWEQGRTLPDPAARTLLNVLAREPDAVLQALGVALEGRHVRRPAPAARGSKARTAV